MSRWNPLQASGPRTATDRRSPLGRSWRLLLRPGLYIKRWILAILVGVLLCALGIDLGVQALVLSDRPWLFGRWGTLFVGVILAGIGLAGVVWAVLELSRSIGAALLRQERMPPRRELVQALAVRQAQQRRRSGPKIVVIGGGTGMPSLLRGLREYTDNLTAVVTVADDGGSSGKLRRDMHVLPPGDFRNNLIALSEAEGLMAQLLQYRFAEADGLGGHNFGNIFITAMAAITGSFEEGLAASSRVLAVRGRILPSTLDPVVLCAEVCCQDGAEERWLFVRGESRIPQAGGRIVRVHLEPEDAWAYPDTIRAILEADLILAAPGSFFTSLMPNLLVPRIQAAIRAASAFRLYVCNLTTQPGETDGFDVSEHMRHLQRHVGDAFSAVLANDHFPDQAVLPPGIQWVRPPEERRSLPYRLFTADLVDPAHPLRHDPHKVAAAIMAIYAEVRHTAGPTG